MSLLMDYIWGEKLRVHFILVVSFNLKCIFYNSDSYISQLLYNIKVVI